VRPLRNAVLSAGEARWLERLSRRERPLGVARIRALKVAWLRASGAGSETDLRAVSVLDPQGRNTGLVSGARGHWFVAEPVAGHGGIRVAVAGQFPASGHQPEIRRESFVPEDAPAASSMLADSQRERLGRTGFAR
jgi:hypothetical protein